MTYRQEKRTPKDRKQFELIYDMPYSPNRKYYSHNRKIGIFGKSNQIPSHLSFISQYLRE